MTVEFDSCSLTIEALVHAADPNGWDVYAADDLLGPVLLTLDAAKGRWIRSELNGLGEGGFTINRHAPEVDEEIFAEGNMVKVRIADCGPDYIDGFILGADNDFALLSARSGQGGEDLVFHGDGALSYLDRARMTPCAFSLDTLLTGLWAKLWATTAVNRPAGVAFDSAEPGVIYVGGLGSRKIRKVDQATLEVVSSSPALWSGDGKYLGGISFDPDDASIVWVLEIPWLSGSSANTKIRKVRRSDWAILATYDLGDDVQLTDIRVDADYVWTTRYDNDRIQQRDKSDPTSVTHSSTITFKGKVQRKPNGIAINGTKVAYWFGGDGGGGTGRALVADTSAYTTITGVQDTKNVSAFGGEWTTEGGEDFLYTVNYLLGKTSKYQLTDATPLCADDSGTFHPEQVSPGALAWRVLVEITHPDRPTQPCPELSYDFTEDADSNGTPWPARTSTEEFTWRVGDRAYTEVLSRLIPAGVTFDLDVNTMTLHAYVDADFGTDRTSATFASGKVRFAEAVNLGVNGDLSRRDNRGQPDTDMTVAGDGGVYGTAELAGRYVREGFMAVTGPTTTAVLDAIGDDELARQRLVADALGFETLWAVETPDATFDDLALVGRYVPKRHYWKGDLVRVDMVAGEFAYDEVDFRVYGTLITEREGKQATPGGPVTPGWRSAIDLGSKYKIPPPIESVPGEGSTGSGSGGGSSGGGSTVITSIPLTVTDPDRGISIPRVTEVRAAGVTSPSPGVAVLPSGGAVADPPLLEELLTDEIDTTLVPHPDGVGGVEWGAEAGSAIDWYFDPRTYGAVLDDTTDDTTAMQACIDAMPEYTTMILPGKAKIAGTLTLPRAIRFLGTGAYMNPDTSPDSYAWIRQASNNTTALQQTAIKRLEIDITIKNSGTNAAGKGVLALGAVHSSTGAMIRDFYDNLFIDGQAGGSYMTDLGSLFLHAAGRANLYLDDKINNFHIRGGFISTGPYGVLASGGFFAGSIDGMAIESYTSAGIYVDGTGPGSGQRTSSLLLMNMTMDVVVAGNIPDVWIGDNSSVQSVTIINHYGELGNAGQTHFRFDGADRVTFIGGHIKSHASGSVSIDGNGATNLAILNTKYDGTLANMPSSFVEFTPSATPGGELGGTWANPTVDATHSGTSHAGAVTTAEAYSDAALAAHTGDSSDAHDASAVSYDPLTSGLSATDVQAAIDELVATARDAGLIPVDTGTAGYAVGDDVSITLTSVWGYDGTDSYYDAGGAVAGQEAALFWDPATSDYVVIPYEF